MRRTFWQRVQDWYYDHMPWLYRRMPCGCSWWSHEGRQYRYRPCGEHGGR